MKTMIKLRVVRVVVVISALITGIAFSVVWWSVESSTAYAQSSTNPVVRFETALGNFSIELFPQTAPNTVANFLKYVNDGDYQRSIIHRSVPGFVIQGGGFRLNSADILEAVPADPPIVNEFRLPNTRGTVSMAKLGGNPNSATSQWFVSLADNRDILDPQNGGFTVFGQVIDDGMTVVDAIAALRIVEAQSPFGELPTINYINGLIRAEHMVVFNNVSVVETALTTGAVSGTSAIAGEAVLFTVVVTPADAPTSTGIAVSADLSSIGGSASQAMFDDATNGDATAGDNTFSFWMVVAGSTAPGAVTIPLTVTDSQSRTASTSIPLTLTRAPGSESFTIADRGATSTTSQGTSGSTTVGYGRIRPDAGRTTPSGLAIFGLTQNDILVAEAGVPAAVPVTSGRIFAQVSGPVNTGLAIANPNGTDAVINFFFTDVNGVDSGNDSLTLGANEQTAKFLNEAPFNAVPSFLGTFTFTSTIPISVVALRGLTNERSEFLITTLPVAPISSTATDIVYFPHFADGAGWTTEVILVNPTDTAITGVVGFLGKGSGATPGAPVTLMLDDSSSGSSFPYSIPGRSSQRFTTSSPVGSVAVGSVRVTPDPGTTSPSGVTVFSLANAGVTVTEAGVSAALPGSAFRVYVEASGAVEQAGSVRSGIAITDTSGSSNTVMMELTSLDGSAVGVPEILVLPPSGQDARFIDEFFTLPENFSGVVRVSSTADFAIVGLRGRTNQRSDFLITTTRPSNEGTATTTSDTYFPHIADAGGWATQFVLFSGAAGQTTAGALNFSDQAGEPLDLFFSSSSISVITD